jgi:hypothetical protein
LLLKQEEMGNSLACCGSNEEDPNNMTTGNLGRDLHSPDKIRMIIKIQATFRGYLDRKRVGSLRVTGGHKSMMHSNHAYQGVANYENDDVIVRNTIKINYILEN